MTTRKAQLTPEQLEARKADFKMRFRALLAEQPDVAAALYIEQVNGLISALQRRASVRAVEGRQLSARDHAVLTQLRGMLATVLDAADRDQGGRAESRLEQLDAVGRTAY